MIKHKRLIPTILSGGAGSRLWPVSRELHPKPFIRLADGQSLLQKVFLRALDLPYVEEAFIVTQRELYFKTEDELTEVNIQNSRVSFILEPFGRNTAAAIAAVSIQIAETYGEDAITLILPSDHLVTNQSAFKKAVLEAMELAVSGKLVTFGIQPTSPETGYGYIEAEAHRVIRFVEKPSVEKAESYLTSGRHFWNSGMFCFQAGTMLQEMQKHCPEIVNATQHCLKHSRMTSWSGFAEHADCAATESTFLKAKSIELNANLFEKVPSDSIDYAVMEKSEQVAVVPCDIGWSDIGSWVALGDLTEPDERGNRIQGDVLLWDTHNSTIHADNGLVGAVGVHNLIIINTPDAVLVANKDRAQDVKHIYTNLKIQNHYAHKFHHTSYYPWGTSTLIEENAGIKIQRFEIKPGAILDIPNEGCESGHCIVIAGVANILGERGESCLQANETMFFSKNPQIKNSGTIPLVIIEVLKLKDIASQ